jgi:hypothetical protein
MIQNLADLWDQGQTRNSYEGFEAIQMKITLLR